MNQGPHVLSIDLDAISANYALLKGMGNGTAVAASIKANAYGLGAAHVAPFLVKQGCRDFFVATFDEALALKPHAQGHIYVFAGLQTAAIEDFKAHGFIPVLNSLADIERYKHAGPCSVFFDTGMNRLGLGTDETARVLEDPTLLSQIDIRLFLSHFACSEDTAHPLNILQCNRIEAIRAALAPHFPKAKWSMCNSSGIFHYNQVQYDLLRPGYALYGGNPTPAKPNPMRPVVTLETRVLQVRNVRAGETIGYSATHRFEANTQTATVCMGYADGFSRAHQAGGAQLYWRGIPCPVLGRVSMDLVTIGIGHLQAQKPQAGDLIEVLGPHQDVDALARSAGTIGYEILTSLGMRYQRRYIHAS